MALYKMVVVTGNNEDFSAAVAVTTGGETPGPFDFTGYGARMHVRESARADFTVLTLSTANGRLSFGVDPSDGVLSFYVPLATIRGIAPGEYDTDLLLSKDGKTLRIGTGTFSIVEGVTR